MLCNEKLINWSVAYAQSSNTSSVDPVLNFKQTGDFLVKWKKTRPVMKNNGDRSGIFEKQ